MGQVTLAFDDEPKAKMKEAAAAAGVSPSQWVSRLLVELAAAEEIRNGEPEDLFRESF